MVYLCALRHVRDITMLIRVSSSRRRILLCWWVPNKEGGKGGRWKMSSLSAFLGPRLCDPANMPQDRWRVSFSQCRSVPRTSRTLKKWKLLFCGGGDSSSPRGSWIAWSVPSSIKGKLQKLLLQIVEDDVGLKYRNLDWTYNVTHQQSWKVVFMLLFFYGEYWPQEPLMSTTKHFSGILFS